jgi:hypothetical protein
MMVSKAEFKRALVAAGGARMVAFHRRTNGGGWHPVAAEWRDVQRVASQYVVLGDSRLDLDAKTTVEGGGSTYTVTWHYKNGEAYASATYVLA